AGAGARSHAPASAIVPRGGSTSPPPRRDSPTNGARGSSGIAATPGGPPAAPRPATAPPAVPPPAAPRARAPSAAAIDTATLIPRALNDPVGLRDSSLIQIPSPTGSSGVQPSTSETSPETSGSTSR